MRFVELFAGAGGLSLGLERAGMTCVGHAEIEPHARAVLRHHWSDVPLWGDVAQLNGADFPACDLLSGGSPCQDLSVAGKRAGIVDGARSSLFFTQARLWRECGAPYLLWENVHGALSSNAGRDFALVLSTLVGAAIPVPADGWRSGGVAAGPDAVAAWRVCDLRYFGAGGFGPPQRRVRVFVLAARAGGVDPAEVLALSAGLCGHPDPRTAAGEGAAAEVGTSVAGSLGSHHTGGRRDDLDSNGCYPVQAVSDLPIPLQEVGKRTGRSTNDVRCGIGIGQPGDPMYTLQANAQHGVFHPLAVTGDHTHALTGEGCDASEDGTGRGTPTVVQPMTFMMRGREDGLNVETREDGTVNALRLPNGGRSGCGAADAVVQPLAFHATQEPISGAESPALGANAMIGVTQPWPDDVTMPLTATDHKGPSSFRDNGIRNCIVQERPRRLMPLECERLMGWPDDHTAHGVDERGRAYALKDTPRYRLCGNGVGAPVAEWIGRRMLEAVQAQQAEEAA